MSAQLKACGLAEAASIRKEGYPVRLNFSAFASRYVKKTNKYDYFIDFSQSGRKQIFLSVLFFKDTDIPDIGLLKLI